MSFAINLGARIKSRRDPCQNLSSSPDGVLEPKTCVDALGESFAKKATSVQFRLSLSLSLFGVYTLSCTRFCNLLPGWEASERSDKISLIRFLETLSKLLIFCYVQDLVDRVQRPFFHFNHFDMDQVQKFNFQFQIWTRHKLKLKCNRKKLWKDPKKIVVLMVGSLWAGNRILYDKKFEKLAILMCIHNLTNIILYLK